MTLYQRRRLFDKFEVTISNVSKTSCAKLRPINKHLFSFLCFYFYFTLLLRHCMQGKAKWKELNVAINSTHLRLKLSLNLQEHAFLALPTPTRRPAAPPTAAPYFRWKNLHFAAFFLLLSIQLHLLSLSLSLFLSLAIPKKAIHPLFADRNKTNIFQFTCGVTKRKFYTYTSMQSNSVPDTITFEQQKCYA